MIRTSCILLLAAVLAAIAPAARAQSDDIRISAAVSSTTAWVGDPIRYTISVESEAEPPRPAVRAPGFEVQEAGQSRRESMQIINGRRRHSIATDFHYHLRPMREGALEIPPVHVEVDGSAYRTQSVWVDVRRPGQTDDFRVIVRPEKATCFVGEPVTVNITFYFQLRVRDFWPSIALDSDRARIDTAPGLPTLPRNARGQRGLEREIGGRTVTGIVGEGELDGRHFGLYTFELLLTPTAPGTLDIGPVTIALDEVTGEDRAGFFDSPFRDRTRTRRIVIASDPVALEVKPLPAEGRPDNFTGLVGRYDLHVAADRASANVGDPIELSLRIRGPEPMLNVRPPSLETSRIAESFRIDSEGWRRTGDSAGERQYSTTVRARSAQVTEFPALELPYFDPEIGEYRIARSGAAPLRIAPTTVVTAADAEFGPAPAPLAPQRLGAGGGGLLANPPAAEALAARGPALTLGQMAPALGAAIVVPPALCAVLLAVRFQRERSQGPSRRAGLRAARRRLRAAGDDPAAAAGALQAWLGAALDVEPAAITAIDAEIAIRPDDPDLADRVATLMRDCDAALYRPGAIADRSLRSRAGALLGELAREGLPR